MIIANKYKITKCLGSGNFGKIYQGETLSTGQLVAVKMEPISSNIKLLKNESKVYEYLNRERKNKSRQYKNETNNPQSFVGIPIIKWFGIAHDHYCMVLNLLGNSLQTIKEKKERFSLKTTLQIGIQMIERVTFVHGMGLVHRDIKPDNFLLGQGKDANIIYLIDFGFCKNANTSVSALKRTSIIGTPNYVSINVHKYAEPTKLDDLESIGYVLLYFYLGKLPWDLLNISNEEMLERKQCFLREEREKGIIPSVFLDFIFLLQESSVSSSINYENMRELFRSVLVG